MQGIQSDSTPDAEDNIVHHPAHDEADVLQAFATTAGMNNNYPCVRFSARSDYHFFRFGVYL